METTATNYEKKKNLYLIIKGSVLISLVLGIIFYYTPPKRLEAIYEFEQHHLFLFCFICGLTFLTFLKLYISIVEKEGAINKKINRLKASLSKKRHFSIESEENIIDNQLSRSVMIDKNDAKNLLFKDNDALQSNELKIHRDNELKRAMVLGNAYKHKVKLFFEVQNAFKHIETTIWFVDENYVTLKEGILIPKKAIYKIIA